MKKRIEMRLGDYRVIGKMTGDGAVTVLVEHALERRIEAEMTLGGDGRSDETAISPQRAEVMERKVLGIGDGEDAVEPASRAQVEPAPLEPSFPTRPGMTRSRVEPSDD